MILYKYLHPRHAGRLSERLLRFSPLAALNDPFEGSRQVVRGIEMESAEYVVEEMRKHYEEQDLAGIVRDAALEEATDFLTSQGLNLDHVEGLAEAAASLVIADYSRREGGLAELFVREIRDNFQETSEAIADKASDLMDALYGATGILCLSAKWNTSLMWSHYAESHSGIVLGLDGHGSFLNDFALVPGISCVRPVSYARGEYKFEGADLSEAIKALISMYNPLFSKGSEWRYEKEWRLIRPFEMCNLMKHIDGEDMYFGQYDSSELREIIIGARATQKTERQVAEFLSSSEYDHVKLYRATLDGPKRTVRRQRIHLRAARAHMT